MNNEQKRLEILNEAKKLNWTSDFKLVEKYLKPYIQIDIPFKPQGIKVGQSKFGGKPDLPANTERLLIRPIEYKAGKIRYFQYRKRIQLAVYNVEIILNFEFLKREKCI